MDEVLELSSDSDTIILENNEEDPEIEAIVKKYITENNLESNLEELPHCSKSFQDHSPSHSPNIPNKKYKLNDSPPLVEATNNYYTPADFSQLTEKYNNFYLEVDENLTGESKKPKDSKKEKKKDRDAAKQEKALIRERKRLEKQEEKNEKKALAEAYKNIKPEECLKQIQVNIDNEIVNSEYGVEILSALQAAQVTSKVEPQAVPNTITWTRKENLINLNGELLISSNTKNTNETLLVMNFKEFILHVDRKTLTTYISNFQSILRNKRIILALVGIQSYFRYQKNAKNKEMRAQLTDESKSKTKTDKIFKDLPVVSRRDIEYALTELQLLNSCSHRMVTNAGELGMMVVQITKSIALAPIKNLKEDTVKTHERFLVGEKMDTVKIDKDGNGLQRLWKQMLTSFHLVSLEKAEAICERYPSFAALMEAYRNCETPQKGETLLEDLTVRRNAGPLTSTQRIGPELSRKIYYFFTAIDGDTLL